MRLCRTTSWLTVLAALLATTPPVCAQSLTADSITGAGTLRVVQPPLLEPVAFAFDVQSGSDGRDPIGTVTIGEFFVAAPVACLAVRILPTNPPVAAATINVETSGFGLVTIEVSDGTPEGIPDTVISDLGSARSPGDCSPLPFADRDTVATVLTGEITIVDAPAVPTSLADCKRGGWRAFPGFDRQGECARFVRRRAG